MGWLIPQELDDWLTKYQDRTFEAEHYIWFEGRPLDRKEAVRLLEDRIRRIDEQLPKQGEPRLQPPLLRPLPAVNPDIESSLLQMQKDRLKQCVEVINNPRIDLSWFAVDNGYLRPFGKAAADWLKQGILARAQAQQAAFEFTFTLTFLSVAAVSVLPGMQYFHLVGWKTVAWSAAAAGGCAAFMSLTDQLIEKYIEHSRAEIDYGQILLNAALASALAIPLAPLGPLVQRSFANYPKTTLLTLLGLQSAQTATDVAVQLHNSKPYHAAAHGLVDTMLMVPTTIAIARPQLLVKKPQPAQTVPPIVIELPVDLGDLRITPVFVEQLGSTVIPVRILSQSGGRLRVWDLGNDARGRIIELALGANLPKNFEVIDRFERETGLIRSIKSKDLRLKTYENKQTVQRVVKEDIDRVAKFSGAEYTIRATGQPIVIRREDIRIREVMLAIPSDTPEQRVLWLAP